jgi:hypothetical protein
MNRTLKAIALGLGGLVGALVLTVGAFAIAGQRIAQPAGVPIFTSTTTPSQSPNHTGSPSPRHDHTESPSPSVDDHGRASGESASGGSSGPDGSGGSADHEGSGSDNSGSGSDESGSGSDESGGSGSDESGGSGSGSGEHGDD